MGLFDKATNRKDDTQNEITDLARQTSNLVSNQNSIENAIAERNAGICLSQCLKVPFKDIAALGTAFAQVIPSLRTITMNGTGYIPVNMNPGDVLKQAKAGFFYGAHKTPDGKSIFTNWVQAGPTNAVMPVNPAAIMMTAMLANIEKKLDTIQATQQKILSFLEQDKQAEQQGNLNVLTDILKGYKHNWDHVQYMQNHHMKTLDIKQASEKNVIFYQEQIASEIKALPTVYLDQSVKDAIAKLEKLFRNYQMALYLFAFSSFLEVMLLGNFREAYLNQVADKVREYNEHYRNQFSQSSGVIKQLSSASLETQIVSGLGNASKAFGKFISSVPLVSNGPVDEWLQASGEQLLKGNDEKISKAVLLFSENAEIGGEVFIDNIKHVGTISNHITNVLFDEDALYLAVS